jgi:hypothetical protein
MDIPKRMGIASIRLQDIIGLRGGFQGEKPSARQLVRRFRDQAAC